VTAAGQVRTARTAAVSGLAFSVLYIVHRLLQGAGPDGSDVAVVTGYELAHRSALLASEVVLGLALLAFIPFAAALAVLVRDAGQAVLAVALGVAATVFVALGFASSAAETALAQVAGTGEPGAVAALQELQGRMPVVWAITALVGLVSLALRRTGLTWSWLAPAGLGLTGIFLLGSVSSLAGATAEGPGSLAGNGIFVIWMLLLSASLSRMPGQH
jgi:hypothetical protein